MLVFLIPLLKKIAPYLKYIIFILTIAILTVLFIRKSHEADELSKAMDLYKRQVSGQLTDKEKELQAANQALGIAQSKMMEQKDLISAYQKDKIASDAAFEAYKKKYNIELESYQRTIAQLQQQLTNGKTVVNTDGVRTPSDPPPDKQFDHVIDPKTTKLAYEWDSGDGRFVLNDPDIFVSKNEIFKANQSFRVTGEIYREKAGFLKTERLTLEEVVPDGTNSDGSPKYKTINSAKIVDSKFNYSEPAPDAWVPKKGVAGVWGIVTGNFALNNGLNPRFVLGTGVEFIQWKGLGVGIQLLFDTNQWKESGFGIDLAYRPTIKGTRLNVGINLGLGTQFAHPFQSYVPYAGLRFYLW